MQFRGSFHFVTFFPFDVVNFFSVDDVLYFRFLGSEDNVAWIVQTYTPEAKNVDCNIIIKIWNDIKKVLESWICIWKNVRKFEQLLSEN